MMASSPRSRSASRSFTQPRLRIAVDADGRKIWHFRDAATIVSTLATAACSGRRSARRQFHQHFHLPAVSTGTNRCR
jgi:hypothetical protein